MMLSDGDWKGWIRTRLVERDDSNVVVGGRLEGDDPDVVVGWRLEGDDPDVVVGWGLEWDGSGCCSWKWKWI